ncbi:MAG: hypothetical protein ACYCPO_14830 [Acidobacteriaceae bacterium]
MKWLQNSIVVFRLSSAGKQELQDVFENSSFSAFVVDADETGAWLVFDVAARSETAPSFLLKWDYVATASIEVSLKSDEPESPRKQIGFQNR